ncbi:hypothetical protein [Streptomyces wuyuanensis]|uniref:hypothetical protein n=1 Tax=Streptomyces wuyuanensis TaxID=1196353 RepID=UPI00343AA051
MDEFAWLTDPEPQAADVVRAGWGATVAALPVGSRITGQVVGRLPFGVFVRIEGVPDARALAEITRMPPGMELPALGAGVGGEVYWHDAHNHQVRVRLDAWTPGSGGRRGPVPGRGARNR